MSSPADNKSPPLAPKPKKKADYYTKGSMEVATETALTIAKLEKRRKLTRNSERVVIVLVGLPGRGKSFVARKLQTFLNWRGTECKVFNVGKYRREAAAATDTGTVAGGGPDDAKGNNKRQEAGSCDANFFDSKNEAAAKLRQEVAALALKDMLKWLDRPDDQQMSNSSPTATSTGITSGGSGSEPSSPRPSYHRSMSTTANSVQTSSIDRVAIFDATNSTVARRQWVLEECTSPIKRANKPTGVVFVESICDDQELLDENFRFKIQNSPDFQGMTEEEAIADLRKRVSKYEEQYETIEDDALSYIKIFNLSSKVMVNHIYGRMAKIIVPALMSWNIGSRPIYICRAGETFNVQSSVEAGEDEEAVAEGMISQFGANTSTDGRDSPHSQGSTDFGTVGVANGNESCPPAAKQNKRTSSALLVGRAALSRGGNLSEKGEAFRDALCDFLWDEGREFMVKRSKAINLTTGTSRDGLSSAPNFWEADLRESVRHLHVNDDEDEEDYDYDAAEGLPFPCHVMASTMPRAVQTATWEQLPYPVEVLSNLNPLDKGDFTGYELEEISEFAPDWYARLEADPFRTRFPGGECYQDLINRLEPAIIDMEQQVGLVVVVSHVSVIQTLMSYFRCTPVQKSAEIAVPIHTVIKFTPARGGGWAESHHKLLEDEEIVVEQTPASPTTGMIEKSPMPIWGDHKPLSRANSLPPVKDMRAKLSVPDIHH